MRSMIFGRNIYGFWSNETWWRRGEMYLVRRACSVQAGGPIMYQPRLKDALQSFSVYMVGFNEFLFFHLCSTVKSLLLQHKDHPPGESIHRVGCPHDPPHVSTTPSPSYNPSTFRDKSLNWPKSVPAYFDCSIFNNHGRYRTRQPCMSTFLCLPSPSRTLTLRQ